MDVFKKLEKECYDYSNGAEIPGYLSIAEIREIMSDSKLASEEEKALFDSVSNGDQNAKKILVEAHQVLISATVDEYLKCIEDIKETFDILQLGMNREKMMKDGNRGLKRAMEIFNYLDKSNFSVEAFGWIHREIHRGIADYFNVSTKILEDIYLAIRCSNELKKTLGIEPSEAEISKMFDDKHIQKVDPLLFTPYPWEENRIFQLKAALEDLRFDPESNLEIKEISGEAKKFTDNIMTRKPPQKELCKHFQTSEFYSIEWSLPLILTFISSLNTLKQCFGSKTKRMAKTESLLHQISDTTCICSKCSREFPIENMEKMFRLFDRMNELDDMGASEGTYSVDVQILKLLGELEPTWFVAETDGKITVLGVEKNPKNWGLLWLRNNRKKIAVLQLPDMGERGGRNRYVCNHVDGEPHAIETYTVHKEDLEMHFPSIGGEAESLLFTNPYGVCKCHRCKRVFTPKEQEKVERLVAYLNTPHYYDEEARSHHEEWKAVLDIYDEGYQSENEPYALFKPEKVLELFQGIEPVLYRMTHRKNKTEILKKLCWDGQKWIC